MLFSYFALLICLSLYSYNLVDPNITLINHPAWTEFRNYMVYWGYYRREVTSVIYLTIVMLLFAAHFRFIRLFELHTPVKIALYISLILLLSYPFLSHDLFNYMFDAKIFTFYGENPYLKKALDFPNDPWLRFMHWTHRTYPYGPVFLGLTFIPSFLSFGKFLPAFIMFKLFFIGFYLLSVWSLNKISRRLAVTFATHPLVIIEGLVNSHNDLAGVGLAIAGIYCLSCNKNIYGRLLFLLSPGIKYMTLPIILIGRGKSKLRWIVMTLTIMILAWLTFKSEIQPWYFLTLFMLLPAFEGIIDRLNIFLMGLLFSYYPYIRLGGWDSEDKVQMKHTIIIVFAALNALYFVYLGIRYKKSELLLNLINRFKNLKIQERISPSD